MPQPHAVSVQASVRVDVTEFAGWSPEQVAAFLAGVAAVLSAADPRPDSPRVPPEATP